MIAVAFTLLDVLVDCFAIPDEGLAAVEHTFIVSRGHQSSA